MTTTEIVLGTEGPTVEYGPMTTQMFVRYSGAAGDLNPMHYNGELARSAGYPSVFSQGMHVAALVAGYTTDWLGAETVRRFGVRFRDQVYPGEVVRCAGRVTEVADTAEGRLVTVAVEATVGDRVAVLVSADHLLAR